MASVESKNDIFIRAVVAKIDRDVKYALQAAGVRMLETARERTPRAGQHLATGALGNSLRISSPDEYSVQLSAGVSHSVYVEYGTGPKGQASGNYPVKDQAGSPIKQSPINYHSGFYIRTDGTKVNTQGMYARPYLRPALQAGAIEFQKAFATLLKGE